ncbi:MAG: tagaturonate epimerase family protein [Candidatus Neomarinimicrobiota bacterium]
MKEYTKPSVLGLKRSFGFGDRLGLATPGHIDAISGSPFLPIFAQQSMRELKRTGRNPQNVMDAAKLAVKDERWTKPWGADADHLQSRDAINLMAANGYTLFTIDPSDHVEDAADKMPVERVKAKFETMIKTGQLSCPEIFDIYYQTNHEIDTDFTLRFSDTAELLRAIVKYGRAIEFSEAMSGWTTDAMGENEFEVEISIDETQNPTSPLEHLFIGLELKRREVEIVSLAPRFIGAFEKGINYKGDLTVFEDQYSKHIAIAKYCGPYKLSIHSGSDKFSVYPIIGRLSGELLHVKTAGTSYLEALRVVCRTDKGLFKDIIEFSRKHFVEDKFSYHVSASLSDVPDNISDTDLEKWYLETEAGRQILHVTFGSVLLSGKTYRGKNLKEHVLDNITDNGGLYREFLHFHLGKHFDLLLRDI